MAPWTYSGDQWISFDNVDSVAFKVDVDMMSLNFLLCNSTVLKCEKPIFIYYNKNYLDKVTCKTVFKVTTFYFSD